jgi:hypothetical protein
VEAAVERELKIGAVLVMTQLVGVAVYVMGRRRSPRPV